MIMLVSDKDYEEEDNVMEEEEVILNRYDMIGEAQKACKHGECYV